MLRYDFVGIDVAKTKLDVAQKIDNKFMGKTFVNDEDGHGVLLNWLKQHTQHPFVCLESTGPYSEVLAEFLVEQDVRVSLVNPMQIKHYAKAVLARNKNDRIDAKIIASFAEKFTPRAFIPRSDNQRMVKEGMQWIDTLNEQKYRLQNQLASIRTEEIRQQITHSIQVIEEQIKQTEVSIRNFVSRHEEYRTIRKRLLNIVGIGEKTVNQMMAHLPDVSQFKTAKQLAAYAGLSPRQYQSGKYAGQTRVSKSGNTRLRNALYMPAIVVKNKNPHFKAFCERLEKNGLKPKQIICAVMRKLLHIMFGMLKHQQDFNPTLV